MPSKQHKSNYSMYKFGVNEYQIRILYASLFTNIIMKPILMLLKFKQVEEKLEYEQGKTNVRRFFSKFRTPIFLKVCMFTFRLDRMGVGNPWQILPGLGMDSANTVPRTRHPEFGGQTRHVELGGQTGWVSAKLLLYLLLSSSLLDNLFFPSPVWHYKEENGFWLRWSSVHSTPLPQPQCTKYFYLSHMFTSYLDKKKLI